MLLEVVHMEALFECSSVTFTTIPGSVPVTSRFPSIVSCVLVVGSTHAALRDELQVLKSATLCL